MKGRRVRGPQQKTKKKKQAVYPVLLRFGPERPESTADAGLDASPPPPSSGPGSIVGPSLRRRFVCCPNLPVVLPTICLGEISQLFTLGLGARCGWGRGAILILSLPPRPGTRLRSHTANALLAVARHCFPPHPQTPVH